MDSCFHHGLTYDLARFLKDPVMVVRSQRVKCHEGQLEVPRNVDDHNALIAAYQEKQLKQLSTLVVQRRLPPMFDNQFGDEDRDLTVGMIAFNLEDVTDERHQNKTIG